jgi:hypothetical protein
VPFLFGGCFILFKNREVILLLGHALYWFSFHLLMLSASAFWHLPDIGNLRIAALRGGFNCQRNTLIF